MGAFFLFETALHLGGEFGFDVADLTLHLLTCLDLHALFEEGATALEFSIHLLVELGADLFAAGLQAAFALEFQTGLDRLFLADESQLHFVAEDVLFALERIAFEPLEFSLHVGAHLRLDLSEGAFGLDLDGAGKGGLHASNTLGLLLQSEPALALQRGVHPTLIPQAVVEVLDVFKRWDDVTGDLCTKRSQG